MIYKGATGRGFSNLKFSDYNGVECSIQKSSLATDDAIWIGVDDANPQIMAFHANDAGIETTETTGWIKYPIHSEALLSTRMHLTREQVAEMLPFLQEFVDSGEIEVD